MPDTEEPKAPQEDPAEASRATQPTEVSEEEYHERSEEFMNALNEKAEALQEGREDVEVEYSVGCFSLWAGENINTDCRCRPACCRLPSLPTAPT